MVDVTTPYATFDDVTKRYNPILTMIGVGTLQVTTNDISSIYIADAQAIINGYLARRYVLPLSPEPILTDLTSDIAIFRVLRDRAPRIPEFMQTRYTDAMSLLTLLQGGQMDLTGSDVLPTSGGDNEAWSSSQDQPPVCTNAEAFTCNASADRLS